MRLKESHDLIRRQGLHQPGLRLHMVLSAVIKIQVLEGIRLKTARLIHPGTEQSRGEQGSTLAGLHYMGRLMGEHHPDRGWIIGKVVPAEEDHLSTVMKRPE